MREPTMITSGQTYEFAIIKRYFDLKRATANELRAENDDFDDQYHFICPITRQPVDKDRLMPNKRIKKACLDFLSKNRWAYDQDPSQSFRSTLIDVRDSD